MRRGLENEKVVGADWGVQVVEDVVNKKLFFTDPGTRHPLETSAGTRYLRPELAAEALSLAIAFLDRVGRWRTPDGVCEHQTME